MSAGHVASDASVSSDGLRALAAPVVVLPPGLDAALEASRRAVKSGRLLWREGQLADAYLHVTDGLATLAAAWGDATGLTPDRMPELAATPRSALREAGYRHAAELERVLRALAQLPPPRADGDYGPAHERLFESAWAEAARLSTFTAHLLRTPAEQRRRWLARAAMLLVALAAFVGITVRIRAQPLVTASAVYSSDAPAAYAVDGVDATEWLLPNGVTGWLDLQFRGPRRVRGVHLRNAHNRHWLDRGARSFRVTAYAGAQAVATAEGEFEALSPNAPTRDVALDARGVTRLRVEVLSTYGAGGGLAEVTVRGP